MTPTATQFQQNRQTSNLTARGSSLIDPLKNRLDRESWLDLAIERAGIMEHDAGFPAPLAKAKAQADTTARFGRCPAPERKSA